jgi:prepilin signal peptidase PulO-like enzyme (type II secretory pathway)
MEYLFLALLGAAAGSFSAALVWRIHEHKDFVKSRSECESCHHQLAARDLVPIFSFLFLKGKCRYCHHTIALSALLMELTGVALFVLSYAVFPLAGVGTVVKTTTLFVIWLLILTGFLILALYDAKYRLLPNKILFPVIALATLYFLISNFFVAAPDPLAILARFACSLIPVTGVYGPLYLIGERTNRHLVGFGDVKLGIAIALLLPWQSALIVLFLANFTGALFALIFIARKKKTLRSLIPFGPFLLLATVVVFLFQITLENVMTLML